MQAIAERCERGETGAVEALDAQVLKDLAARRLVRTRVIPALRTAGDQAGLARALHLWLEVEPAKVSDWLLLVATLGRLGRDNEAQALLDRLLTQHPDDPGLAVSAIQLALRQGRNGEASRIADNFEHWREVPARAVQLGMTALLRDDQPQRALALGNACTEELSGAVSARMAEAYLSLDNPVMGARMAQRALASGHDNATVRLQLARAASAQFEYDRAIAQLTAAVEASPDNVRALASLGELMLIKRRPKAARAYLERALDLAPDLVHLRALAGRALKDLRNYEGAANEYAEILRREPGNVHYRRQASSVFKLANRPEAASALLMEMVDQRRRNLPETLEGGLEDLWNRLDSARIPKARFDWAWSLRESAATQDREEWERRARWGWLADRLIQEWLEISPDRAEEAMGRLADLGPGSETLELAAHHDGGLILVSAHLGPLFAGPLALQLLNLECKWLASTPSIDSMAYAEALISTSDQTESQVVRLAMNALDTGISVAIAVDGAMTLAAPRVPFEGQEVTYSSFAARLAHRRQARSFFVAPLWRDGGLAFDMTELPRAEQGEPLEPFLERWRDAWFATLRSLLKGAPENLRLSGGIWRHIRPLQSDFVA